MPHDENAKPARNAQLPALSTPGSAPIRNRVHERYCRYRAEALPTTIALRQAAMTAFRGRKLPYSEDYARVLERKPHIQQRIQYLVKDVESAITAKRARLEERLWAIHEADIGQCFETIELDGKTIERPKRLSDIDPEIRKNIEKIAISASGRVVPQMYSKLAASQELQRLLGLGKAGSELQAARLSDAELVAQLSEQANQLGVKIDLSYSFDGDQSLPQTLPQDGFDAEKPDETSA